ncbi:NIPA-like protein 3 [Perkinsus olseni]|uniref:NIPA-like protein 3 n=1 Tax=Perkinsus olseni TaxID=32597 RepID=A0A7J6LCB6_PEROL|nr:NIPA-like protein 3 [Perkinsus olseni]KAF4656620.1 NIPA-like protein 3 [Perkinsus olseni]
MLEAFARPGSIGVVLLLLACMAINLGMIFQKLATVKSGVGTAGFWASCGFSMEYLTNGIAEASELRPGPPGIQLGNVFALLRSSRYLWLGLVLYSVGQYGCLHALAMAPHFTYASLNALIIISNSILSPLLLGEKHKGWSLQCAWLMAAGSTAVLMADGSTLIGLLVDGSGSSPVKEHVWQREAQLESHFAQRPFLVLISIIAFAVVAAALVKILSVTSSRLHWVRHTSVDILLFAVPAAMLASLALLFVRSVVHLALTSLSHPETIWFLTKPQWGIIAVGATAGAGGLFLLNLGLMRFNTLWFLPVYYSVAAVLQAVVAGIYFEEFRHLGARSMMLVGLGGVMNVAAVWMLLRTAPDDDEGLQMERTRICLTARLPDLYMEEDGGGDRATSQWPGTASSLTAASLFKLAGLHLAEISPASTLRLGRERRPYMVGSEEGDSSIWSWSAAGSEAAGPSVGGERPEVCLVPSGIDWDGLEGETEASSGASVQSAKAKAPAKASESSRWGFPSRFSRTREASSTSRAAAAAYGDVGSSEKSPCRAACVVINLGMILQKRSVKVSRSGRPPYLQPLWVGGFTVFLLGQVLSLWSLSMAPQSMLSSLGSSSLVSNSILAPILLGEKHTAVSLYSTGILLAGSLLVVSCSSRASQEFTPASLMGLFSMPQFLAMSGGILALMAYLGCRRIRTGQLESVYFGTLSALLGALSVLFAKCVSILVLGGRSESLQSSETAVRVGYAALVVLNVTFSILSVYVMNLGIIRYRALEILPVYYSLAVVFQTVTGGVFFQEFVHLSSQKCLGLAFGVLLTCVGVQTLATGAESTEAEGGPVFTREPLLREHQHIQRSYSEAVVREKQRPVGAEPCTLSLHRVPAGSPSLACLDFGLTRRKSS